MYIDKKYKTSSSTLALILKILDLISVDELQLCLEKKSNCRTEVRKDPDVMSM